MGGTTLQRILIIERDEPLRRVLAELLTVEGYRTLQTSTCERGLFLASRHRPSAVVLGLGMPPTFGFRLLEMLKRAERTRDIPVVGIATVPCRLIAAQPQELDGLVPAPFDTSELLTHLERAIGYQDLTTSGSVPEQGVTTAVGERLPINPRLHHTLSPRLDSGS
jgi:DNA-binding response OmpR family regulator